MVKLIISEGGQIKWERRERGIHNGTFLTAGGWKIIFQTQKPENKSFQNCERKIRAFGDLKTWKRPREHQRVGEKEFGWREKRGD